MKILLKASLAATALVISQSALAETCEEKFARLLIDGNGDEPVRIIVTQEIKGGMKTTSEMLQAEQGHWITMAIEPPDMAWSLIYDNVLYTSADKGESWSKVRDMDSLQMAESAKENRRKDAGTVRNAACGEEELDGRKVETIEAEYEVTQGFKSRNRNKYWVDPETGRIVKATYDLKADGFESFTTQLLELAPDVVVPTPQ